MERDAAPAILAVVRPSLEQLEILRDEPHRFLLDLRRTHGPAVLVRFGPFRFFLLSDPAHVQSVLVAGHREFTKDTFQYRLLSSVTGEGLLTMDGPAWLARRRLEQPRFHQAAVRVWTGLIVRATERVLEEWETSAANGAARDVARDMLRLALDVVAGAMFPPSFRHDPDAILDATLRVLSHIRARSRTLGLVPPWLPTRANNRFRRALRTLDAIFHETIRIARAAGPGGSDLLGHLMFDGDGSPTGLSDRQLRDEMLTLTIAGHETVASALAWAWHLLAEHPHIADRLALEADSAPSDKATGPDSVLDGAGAPEPDFDRLTFASNVFDETLRLYPPAWVITRKATRTETAAGITIPAGGLVAISPWVLHRDASLWTEPERFDPDRFAGADRVARNAFIPFGAGPHLCIGVHLARLEARIVLGLLGRRFRVLPLPERPPVAEPGVTLHPKDGLWLRIERRAGEAVRPVAGPDR